MIPKGNLHAHGGRLAAYITKGEDGEQAELIEMRGFAETDLRAAFCDIQAIAESQTQCEKPFFHAYVRLPADESLSREQWLQTANRIEAALGFDGQPRGVALHFLEDGTTHMHVAWSRIDTDQMKAIDPGLYIRKMKEVCRELEVEFGLRELSSDRPADRLTKEPKRPEFEEARRLGVPVEQTREIIRDCYSRSDNGSSFQAALAEHGFAVARGDRRDFVVLDEEGGKHALGKSICGETAEQIRARFGAAFKQSLPTIAELAEQMQVQRDAAPEVSPEPSITQPTREAIKAEVTALWAASDTGQAFAASLHEHGYSLARGDRRDFVLIDPHGDIYALPRMIDGARTADVRAKLQDIDPASLPTVAEAKSVTEFVAARGEATGRDVVSDRAETVPDSSQEPGQASEARDDRDVAAGPARAADAIAGAIGEALGMVADALGDILAPSGPPTAEQIEDRRQQAQCDAAVAEQRQEVRREMTEDEARRAAIAKAHAEMEAALRQDRDARDQDEYGYERTR